MVHTALERVLARITARALQDSPRTAALLSQLRDRRLLLTVRGTPLRLLIESSGEQLRAVLDTHLRADAHIDGAPLSLLALAGEDAQAVIRRGDVRIDGDLDVAQRFRDLAMLLRPDLENELAPLLGRSGAHLAMRGLRQALDWGRGALWTSAQNVADYMAHESRTLVSLAEAEHYLSGVEQLREQLDRLDARVVHIDRHVRRLHGDPAP